MRAILDIINANSLQKLLKNKGFLLWLLEFIGDAWEWFPHSSRTMAWNVPFLDNFTALAVSITPSHLPPPAKSPPDMAPSIAESSL
jgi:hypothetical protein